uniref:PGG domain-containing protein n=1 Tax=Leersia perrieri TaxID=77586 RepID=A0A0D9XJ17_9ORYZ
MAKESPEVACVDEDSNKEFAKEFRERIKETRGWLLAIAGLIASVTYQAGFNPPGGVWGADDEARGQVAGTPILHSKSPGRYYTFCCSNAIAFTCSVFLILILGGMRIMYKYVVLTAVTLLDVTSLLLSYAVGSSTDHVLAAFIAVIVVLLYMTMAINMVVVVFSQRRPF